MSQIDAARFTAAYEHSYADVLRFVRRRVSEGADDVVAETMTTAWRRIGDLPPNLDDARAWIFGIARNTMLNQRRSARRQDALGVRLAEAPTTSPDAADIAIPRADLARAWARLDPADQEILALTVLDGLTSPEAGAVLGITPIAYRHRLARARTTLRTHLLPILAIAQEAS